MRNIFQEEDWKEIEKTKNRALERGFIKKKFKIIPIFYDKGLSFESENGLDTYLKEIPKICIKEITTSFLWDNPDWFLKRGFIMKDRFDVVVDLSQSEEELFMKLDHSVRKNVKKCINLYKLKVKKVRERYYFDSFYNLYLENATRLKKNKKILVSKDFFDKIYEKFILQDKGNLFVILENNKIISGLMVIRNSFYSFEIMIAYSDTKMNSNDLIKWEVILDSKRRGLKYFNLSGVTVLSENEIEDIHNGKINKEDTRYKLYQIYRFKKKFGEIKKYHTYIKPKWIAKFLKK